MDLKPLHDSPKYMEECAEVLNEEWKRSLTARLHSLEKSRDSFPVCLILLLKDDAGETSVIGHSRLSDVRGQPKKSCLVESVVVKKSLRGKGYGRILMKKTEEFATSKGYQTMYLTTHDKQDFYAHIGYEFCQTVVSLGSDILPDHLAEKLFGSLNVTNAQKDGPAHQESSGNIKDRKADASKSGSVGEVKSETDTQMSAINTTAQKLDISNSLQSPAEPPKGLPPPPPKAPPPPVAPPPPAVSKPKTAANEAVVRWDPSKVSWMRKHIS